MNDQIQKTLSDIPTTEPNVALAELYAVYGLLTDGGHHKQWYLEIILQALGTNLDKLKVRLSEIGYEWDEGIAP